MVRVTSTVPADPFGEVTAQLVVDEQSTDVAGVTPKLAVVNPTTKPLPVTVTTVPPPRAGNRADGADRGRKREAAGGHCRGAPVVGHGLAGEDL